MRRWTILAALIAVALWAGRPATTDDANPEHREPPMELTIEVGGKTVETTSGVAVMIEVDGKPLTVKATTRPTRRFDRFGIRFRYPAGHAWAASREGEVTSFKMDGSDSVLQLFHNAEAPEPVAFMTAMAQGMAAQLGGGNARRSAVTLQLGARRLQGIRLDLSVAGQALRMDFAAFREGGATVVLIVQDSLDDNDRESAEVRGLKQLLAQSFRFPGEKD